MTAVLDRSQPFGVVAGDYHLGRSYLQSGLYFNPDGSLWVWAPTDSWCSLYAPSSPEAFTMLRTIVAAGANGISRSDLAAVLDLDVNGSQFTGRLAQLLPPHGLVSERNGMLMVDWNVLGSL